VVSKEQRTIAQICLRSIVQIVIGRDNEALYHHIDWEREIAKFQPLATIYPIYYTSQNFHGIKGGYLSLGFTT
jgi:hypothetical protein